MAEKPRTMWSPRKAWRQWSDSTSALERLGVKRGEEPPPDYVDQVQDLRAKQRKAISSGRKQIAACSAIAFAVALGVQAIRRAIRPDYIKAYGEMSELIEEINHGRVLANGKYKLDPAEHADREKKIAKDKRNARLLREVEPSWRQLINGWLNKFTEETFNDRAYLRELQEFFITHGRPFVFTGEGDNRITTIRKSNEHDFTYTYLKDPIETLPFNDGHKWLKYYNIPHYDPESRMLFIFHAVDDMLPTDRPFFLLQMMDVLIALHDAKSHIETGTVRYDDPRMKKLLAFARQLLEQSGPYRTLFNVQDEKQRGVAALRIIAEKFVSTVFPNITDENKRIVMVETMIYRYARIGLLLKAEGRLDSKTIEVLEAIVRNPRIISAKEETHESTSNPDDPENVKLLKLIKPSWEAHIQDNIDRDRKNGNTESSSARQKVFQFYLDHGVPLIYDPNTQRKNAATGDPQSFAIDHIDSITQANPKHNWFKKYKICYYDPAQKVLFINSGLVVLENVTEDQGLAVLSAMSEYDVLFALIDAYEDRTAGSPNLSSPLFMQTQPKDIGLAWIGDVPDLENAAAKVEKSTNKLETTLLELGKFINRFVEQLLFADPKHKPQGENMLTIKRIAAYRFARLIFTMKNPKFGPLLPQLAEIVDDPTLIDKMTFSY